MPNPPTPSESRQTPHTLEQCRDIASDMRRMQEAGTFPETLGQMDPERIEWLCNTHASSLARITELQEWKDAAILRSDRNLARIEALERALEECRNHLVEIQRITHIGNDSVIKRADEALSK